MVLNPTTTRQVNVTRSTTYAYGVILPVKIDNPNLVTFPGCVLLTFWAKKNSMPGRHPGMASRHEKMNFRNFRQPLLYDTFWKIHT